MSTCFHFSSFKHRFPLLFLILLTSCGLKYEAVESPRDLIEKRQKAVIEQLNADFTSREMTYTPYKFGQSATIKPSSHFVLDSLYAIKYKLEQKQLIDKKLDERIAIQRQIILQDTSETYYLEKHVFSVVENAKFTAFLADVSVNSKQEVLTLDIIEAHEIDKNLISYFSSFVLKESFIYPNTYPDQSELAFYELYREKMEDLTGKEKTDFLNFTLTIMRIAQKGKNIDKSYLIKQMVRNYAQGEQKNYMNERFDRLEEFYNDKNEVSYFLVDYTFFVKEENQDYKAKRVQVFLDPYLQLMELVPLEKK